MLEIAIVSIDRHTTIFDDRGHLFDELLGENRDVGVAFFLREVREERLHRRVGFRIAPTEIVLPVRRELIAFIDERVIAERIVPPREHRDVPTISIHNAAILIGREELRRRVVAHADPDADLLPRFAH